MAAEQTRDYPDLPPGEFEFDKVIRAEIDAINARRACLERELLPTEIGYNDERKMIDALGLALSGGGIRSAAISLGVLQALNQYGVIERIDYLSTVSGGGYIGASLSATMTASAGEFVFGGSQSRTPGAAEISDTKPVGHIRNYSNYLIPSGLRDVLTGLAIVVRGLAANLGFVLPVMLLAAAFTIAMKPVRWQLLEPGFLGMRLELPQGNFRVTLVLAILGGVLFLLWAFYRSFLARRRLAEFRTLLPVIGAAYLCLVGAMLFFEFQPFVLADMFDVADKQRLAAAGGSPPRGGLLFGVASTWIEDLAAIATPIAALVTFFRQQVGEVIKTATASSRMQTKILGLVARLAVWIAGLALPLLIWLGYVTLAYWGIADCGRQRPTAEASCPAEKTGNLTVQGAGVTGAADSVPKSSEGKPKPDGDARVGPRDHAPVWMSTAAAWFDRNIPGRPSDDGAMTPFYVLVGALLLLLTLFLRPNANSLHRLYRDRLSKAFLFHPTRWIGTAYTKDRDFQPLDTMLLSEINTEYTPYHLINAALNIQGSDFANRRGRNADFFMLSPLYSGSFATGYRETTELEAVAADFDLATAMATSGASVSSNMGSKSIRALTPTLALLNVRLGYWLKNPYFDWTGKKPGKVRQSLPFLIAEIGGWLYEDTKEIYLTDGGHIENLGIYELLRRRCRLIIVVDAEADPEMHFTSLIALERYARIDLGVRINMPWLQITEATRAWMGVGSPDKLKSTVPKASGPHIAIGTIDYGGNEKGNIVYVKSSLTGDENDYVRDYARRYDSFPHETTGDQFFNEEQFEVYRALGFHMVSRFLDGKEEAVLVDVDILGPPPPPTGTGEVPARSEVVKANHPALAGIRGVLGLTPPPANPPPAKAEQSPATEKPPKVPRPSRRRKPPLNKADG